MIWEHSGSGDPRDIWYIMLNAEHLVLGEIYTTDDSIDKVFYTYFYHPPCARPDVCRVSELEQISEEQWTYYFDHPDEFYMEWLL